MNIISFYCEEPELECIKNIQSDSKSFIINDENHYMNLFVKLYNEFNKIKIKYFFIADTDDLIKIFISTNPLFIINLDEIKNEKFDQYVLHQKKKLNKIYNLKLQYSKFDRLYSEYCETNENNYMNGMDYYLHKQFEHQLNTDLYSLYRNCVIVTIDKFLVTDNT